MMLIPVISLYNSLWKNAVFFDIILVFLLVWCLSDIGVLFRDFGTGTNGNQFLPLL
jgi:multisubunit Na+/H+ antiporter MnhF subunit